MPVYSLIPAFADIINKAYSVAFQVPEILDGIQGINATMAVWFKEENFWWHITINDGHPVWQSGQIDSPDMCVQYRCAKNFHDQFIDSRQFMLDALNGDIEITGNLQATDPFRLFAEPFQKAFLDQINEYNNNPHDSST